MKRLMIISWCFCGLIAYVIFGGGGLADPDTVWGALSRTLLGTGLLGLMLVGILAADMSAISAQCLVLSALFVRNFYLFFFPHKSDKEGLALGRFLIPVALLSGIGVALYLKDMITFMKVALTFNVPFGAAIWAIFKWRGVRKGAVIASIVASLFVIVFIPLIIPAIPSLSRDPALHLMTKERREEIVRKATKDEVAAGLAKNVGDPYKTIDVIAPKAVFFEKLLAVDPANPQAGKYGASRFHLELFILHLLGLDLTSLLPSHLFALYYLFDAAFPLVLIFLISLFLRERDPARAERFYIKMRTPAVADPEQDEKNLSYNLAHPEASEKRKLFPKSSWELQKWNRFETIGFFACCGIALAILFGFGFLLRVGA